MAGRNHLTFCICLFLIVPHLSADENTFSNFEFWLNFNEYYRLELFQQAKRAGSENIYLETSVLPLVWLAEDPYNGNRSNFSAHVIINPALAYLQKTFNPNKPGLKYLSLYTARLLTNGRINWVLNPNYNNNSGFKSPSNHFKLFVQNNTDFFAGRSKLWIGFLPGFGLGYVSTRLYYINVGYLRGIDYKFSSMETDNRWYISAGLFLEALL